MHFGRPVATRRVALLIISKEFRDEGQALRKRGQAFLKRLQAVGSTILNMLMLLTLWLEATAL